MLFVNPRELLRIAETAKARCAGSAFGKLCARCQGTSGGEGAAMGDASLTPWRAVSRPSLRERNIDP
jgi:hypothetical protein